MFFISEQGSRSMFFYVGSCGKVIWFGIDDNDIVDCFFDRERYFCDLLKVKV